jgi:hypothetical protein
LEPAKDGELKRVCLEVSGVHVMRPTQGREIVQVSNAAVMVAEEHAERVLLQKNVILLLANVLIVRRIAIAELQVIIIVLLMMYGTIFLNVLMEFVEQHQKKLLNVVTMLI